MEQLLSAARLGAARGASKEHDRTPFQRDFDRIVFSSPFRRLQDKTQVHPLPNSDYVRRRLTHSIEVSCVARSLGTHLGQELRQRNDPTLSSIEEIRTSSSAISSSGIRHFFGIGHAGSMEQNRKQMVSDCELSLARRYASRRLASAASSIRRIADCRPTFGKRRSSGRLTPSRSGRR
jgi:dGTP triphosphohydrolase